MNTYGSWSSILESRTGAVLRLLLGERFMEAADLLFFIFGTGLYKDTNELTVTE